MIDAAKRLVEICTERKIKVAAAESCTGGMISELITSVSGSSAVIEFGVCSYSNRIKHEILGVSEETLEKFSEYSEQCAKEMAEGARRISGADIAVSTTGVAGPSGGTDKHPVGEVFIGLSSAKGVFAKRYRFLGNRDEVRRSAADEALKMLLASVSN